MKRSLCLVGLREMDEHEAAAADVAGDRMHDGEREAGGDCRIDRVAALLQDGDAGVGGVVVHADHHGVVGGGRCFVLRDGGDCCNGDGKQERGEGPGCARHGRSLVESAVKSVGWLLRMTKACLSRCVRLRRSTWVWRLGWRGRMAITRSRPSTRRLALHDLVTVTARRAAATGIVLTSNDERVPTDARNTAWKMVERALAVLGVAAEVAIHIEKRLPVQGGLGAGSANAAAALLGLERELGCH